NAAIDKQIAERNRNKLEPEAQKKRLAELSAKRRTWEHWQVVYDVGPPTPTHLLRRGSHDKPGPEVGPGFPAVLCETTPAFPAAGGSSGRRLALARWLNAADTPAGALVLRVRVNRVWRHLFGRGLVEPGDNFGLSGERPTHPELLD